jgi:hypothetical protein
MAAKAGRARSRSAAAPPTMMLSEPSMARLTPPDTGASSSATPEAARSRASFWVSTGLDELMSSTSAPAARPSRAASRPSISAWRTTLPSGSMVINASAPWAAALADAVAKAEGWAPTKSDTAFCETSNRRSLKPAPTRRAVIGRPIMPRPMKAMVAGGASAVMRVPGL